MASKKKKPSKGNNDRKEKARVKRIIASSGEVARPPEGSLRLGKRVSARAPFQLDMRMPDWHIDADSVAITLPGGGSPTQLANPLFPEETVGKNVHLTDLPFQIQAFDQISAPSQGWLGGPLPPNDGKPLNGLLNELAKRARNYNCNLYLLRLYHFASDRNVCLTNIADNPSGPLFRGKPFPLPDIADGNFPAYAKAIEKMWYDSALELNAPLEYINPSLKDLALYTDMIQVNGYIVSMRVVLTPPSGPISGYEISGSSSHVSINYPFSST